MENPFNFCIGKYPWKRARRTLERTLLALPVNLVYQDYFFPELRVYHLSGDNQTRTIKMTPLFNQEPTPELLRVKKDKDKLTWLCQNDPQAEFQYDGEKNKELIIFRRTVAGVYAPQWNFYINPWYSLITNNDSF
ncbi:MAG: hypothetical protein KKH52_03545 [Nanoarchaeota archaeon]|nr:hypothetical protein [Nanoarchaeota archaeon]MBU1623055.1 hypothetical protein [Nanoarchaeota archaeon]MBU1974441.1 hypothetical protein [Nanoarchaeota archaeon]